MLAKQVLGAGQNVSILTHMKLKDIAHWCERWSTPLGTMDANAPVADGVLVDLSLWGTSIIGLAVQCPDGKYFGSIRALSNVYD